MQRENPSPNGAGLEGLKQLLRSFEWLMERLMPRAKAHLEVGTPSLTPKYPLIATYDRHSDRRPAVIFGLLGKCVLHGLALHTDE